MWLFCFTISDVNYFVWTIYILENGLKIWLICLCMYEEQLYWLSDGKHMRNICNVLFTAEWGNWVPKTNRNFPALFTLRVLSLAHKRGICKDMTMSRKLIRHLHSATLSHSLQYLQVGSSSEVLSVTGMRHLRNKYFFVLPLFFKGVLTATELIRLCVTNHSTCGPLWYIQRWHHHVPE
jgi:hypothetical protein